MTTTPTTRPRCGRRSRRCASSSRARLIAVFQPHLYSRTKAFAEEFGAALALADEVAVLDVYPAREEPVGELAGVSGLEVARAAAERMGGRRVWWLPDRRARPRRPARPRGSERGRAGSAILVTLGAGDVFRLGEALVGGGAVSAPPAGVERDYPLARLTTVRTGGAGRLVRPPGDRGGAGRAACAGPRRGPARRSGRLGLEPAGSRRWIPRTRDQAGRRPRRDRARGRARALRRRRPAALGGGEDRRLGTLGPRVRDQHPRHRRRGGADERQRLRRPARPRARVGRGRDRGGRRAARARADSASPTAAPTCGAGEVVARASLPLAPGDPEEIRATLAEMRERRREAQPSGIKTFGSTFKNPEDERAEGRSAGQLLDAAGCRGLRARRRPLRREARQLRRELRRAPPPPTCSS